MNQLKSWENIKDFIGGDTEEPDFRQRMLPNGTRVVFGIGHVIN